MDESRWARIHAAFDELVELPEGERSARVEELRGGDPELARWLDALLAADARADERLLRLEPALAGDGAAAPDPLALGGRTVSHFRVLEPLGTGGMGVVYRAEDLRLGRTVALKFVLPRYAPDPRARARFLREAHSAAVLDHPNICTVHEVGEDEDGRPFIAMGCYAGETLRTRLARDGALPVEQALEVARQTARGLACAHAAGIVHRDLKPANLMLTPEGTVRILDFGLATARDLTLSDPDAGAGTAAYMSPEQLRGAPADARTDLWSLGVVLAEMLTGRRPVRGDRAPAGLPAALAPLVERLLAPDPADRPQSAAEVLRALDAAEMGAAAAGPPADAGPPRRRPHARTVAAVVLLGLAGTGVALRAHRWMAPDAARRPPAPGVSSVAGARPLDAGRVAVAVFENRTGDRALDPVGSMAADWITRGLVQTGVVDVVDAPALHAHVREAAADAHAYARRNGAGTLVAGSYYRSGDSLYFEAAVRDARTGRVRRALDPIATPLVAPVRGIEALRARVAGALATVLDVRAGAFVAPAGAPPTFEAYREFVAGQRYWHATGANRAEQKEAIPHFAAAFRLDSTFHAAAWWLMYTTAVAHVMHMERHVGRRCEQVDSLARLLAPRRARIDPVTPLPMDAPRLMCHRDWRGIARAARASSVRFPRSTWVQLYAARAALYGGRPLEARATLRRLDPDRDLGWLEPPRAEYWEARALAEHALGDTAAESAVVRAFARSAPGTMAAATLEVRALAARGRDSAVFARLDAADGEHAEAEHDAGSLAYVAAMEFVAHGRDGAARAAAERALASFRARARVGRFDWTATRWGIERSLELLGRYDEATRWARELAAHDTAAVEYRATLGVLAARRGDRAEAARMDAWLAGRTSPYERADATLGRMEIAAALGERERTLGLLREAISQGYQPFFPDHFHVVRRTTLRGDPEYEALVRPRG